MTADAFRTPGADVFAAAPSETSSELALRQPSTLEPLTATVPARKSWPMAGDVLTDAMAQTRPYNGDRDASDQAWSARVDAAVQGMDVVDSAGLDDWMTAHAAADEPHVWEAELVAAWETHVRDFYSDPPCTATEPLAIEATATTTDVDEDGAWEL